MNTRLFGILASVLLSSLALLGCETNAGRIEKRPPADPQSSTLPDPVPPTIEDRGERLTKITKLGVIPADEITKIRKTTRTSDQKTMFDKLGKATCGVEISKVNYVTAGSDGTPVTVSGLLVQPTQADGTAFSAKEMASKRWLAQQHGTLTERKLAPSNALSSQEGPGMIIAYGGNCWIVTAADYIGLGDSLDVHPYLDAKTESMAAIDLIQAVYEINKTAFAPRALGIYGYSQGGHAALALQRDLEAGELPGFGVRASVAGAAPADLAGTGVAHVFAEKPSTGASLFMGYFINGLQASDPKIPLEQILVEPFLSKNSKLFSGVTPFDQILGELQVAPQTMLEPKALASLNSRDGNSVLLQALERNQVYKFVPQAPTLFIHGEADSWVPAQHSIVAIGWMRANGAKNVSSMILPNLDHPQAGEPAFYTGMLWLQGQF
jgi:pimeloyl-ACP methyl ester carboxylesterase